MNLLFADAIDVPYVVAFGLLVLVPLLVFEVVVEALVLKLIWRVQFANLCRFTFVANTLSLMAGIPVKILNASLYNCLLPDDLPGYFACYPMAVAIGSLIYFVVTLGVEGAYAFRWLARQQLAITSCQIWKGILLANLASYVVLAPLHYYFTRPTSSPIAFTPTVSWTSHPSTRMLFVDAQTENLQVMRLDGSERATIVPMPVRDYLLSTNMNICLFRGTNGNLYLHRQDTGLTQLIWQTSEPFFMNAVAFSPSGQFIAFASENSNLVELVNVQSGTRARQTLAKEASFGNGLSIAWSTTETEFLARRFEKNVSQLFTITPRGGLLMDNLTNASDPQLLPCFGRVGDTNSIFRGNWGISFSADSCGDLEVLALGGLDGCLTVLQNGNPRTKVLNISVNPGLLHIPSFGFRDVALLDDCKECLFEVNGYTYLLDIDTKRVGTLVHGERFILLTPRYQKRL